jgi:hypothetical protein
LRAALLLLFPSSLCPKIDLHKKKGVVDDEHGGGAGEVVELPCF